MARRNFLQTREFCFRDGVHEIAFEFNSGSPGSYWEPPEEPYAEIHSCKTIEGEELTMDDFEDADVYDEFMEELNKMFTEEAEEYAAMKAEAKMDTMMEGMWF